MDDAAAFNDMKEYLSEQQIGFREISSFSPFPASHMALMAGIKGL